MSQEPPFKITNPVYAYTSIGALETLSERQGFPGNTYGIHLRSSYPESHTPLLKGKDAMVRIAIVIVDKPDSVKVWEILEERERNMLALLGVRSPEQLLQAAGNLRDLASSIRILAGKIERFDIAESKR